MLDEYWERHARELRGIPVLQASGLARKALGVFQTYLEMMNEDIKRAIATRNPFNFRRVAAPPSSLPPPARVRTRWGLACGRAAPGAVCGRRRSLAPPPLPNRRPPPSLSTPQPKHNNGGRHVKTTKTSHAIPESGPCVVMATPSMLQSGLSRDLFEAWCEEPNNTVIIADFAVQGTLARDVLQHPATFLSTNGYRMSLKCAAAASRACLSFLVRLFKGGGGGRGGCLRRRCGASYVLCLPALTLSSPQKN